MEAHFVSSPHTSSSNPDALLDIAMACVNGTSELMAAARSLMSCLSTVVAGPAMGTSTPFSLSSSAMTARAILGCIRSVSCVGADRFVSTVLCVLRDQGLAQNHLDVMTQHLREQQASVDAALDRVSTSLDALVQQQAIEATAAVPGIGQEQGAAGDVEGGNGGIVAEDAMVIESDSNDPVASAPTPATAPVPIPGQEAQLEPEPEPQQEPPFQQVQADVDDDMMLADAPGAAWDPDQDATYPFGDVMWLDRSWERILVYRGKSLMVLAKPRPTGEHDSNQSSNE
ncbi:hypothetical protein BCR44DRAFT_39280 [Catenaria anguillulae PL171]|uniref:Uncharacterized protein n=1 Tax=Catenaria anguillulae PL171 TaxID=765915 RepID=A0A1Y2I492_9FUNG|nr:hypothetical protein BCR44DRAFT_39280 [Catenaria anguillulae PL171]